MRFSDLSDISELRYAGNGFSLGTVMIDDGNFVHGTTKADLTGFDFLALVYFDHML